MLLSYFSITLNKFESYYLHYAETLKYTIFIYVKIDLYTIEFFT